MSNMAVVGRIWTNAHNIQVRALAVWQVLVQATRVSEPRCFAFAAVELLGRPRSQVEPELR